MAAAAASIMSLHCQAQPLCLTSCEVQHQKTIP